MKKTLPLKEVEEVNIIRRVVELADLNIKRRMCLKCGCMFKSEGNHNRLCDVCVRSNKLIFDGDIL